MAINLTPNVYAHWKLNETSGILVSDSSIPNRDGTTANMESEDWVFGKLNNCLQFDGSNEYVNFESIARFERTEPFSVECWFKTTISGSMVLLGNRGNAVPQRGWQLSFIGTELTFLLHHTTGNSIKVHIAGIWNDDIWHHVIVTYDGSSIASHVKFYLDGSLKSTLIDRDTLTGSIISTTNTQIAARDGANLCYTGFIDEAIIYDKKLSQKEVTFRWNNGIGTENMEAPPPPVREKILCNWDKTTSVYSRTISWFGVWVQMVNAIKNAFNNFTTDGYLFLHDNKTEWECLRVAVNNVKVPATKQPEWVSYKGGLVLSFDNQEVEGNEEEVYFVIQLPHSIKEGSAIKPCVHWTPKSNEAGKVVRWGMSYSFANMNETFSAETTIYAEAVTNNDADKHIVGHFPDIPLPTMKIASMFVIKFFRNSSSGFDTYTDEAYLLEFDIHVEKNTLGSREVLVK